MNNMRRTINSYQKSLSSFVFKETSSIAEAFAIDRFHKKFEKPDDTKADSLHLAAWDALLLNEAALKTTWSGTFRPNGIWYKARLLIHQWLKGYNRNHLLKADFRWPQGSEVGRIYGESIQARLDRRERWTVTYDAFDDFSDLVYNCSGLKKAAKERWNRIAGGSKYEREQQIRLKGLQRYGWDTPEFRKFCFDEKMAESVDFVYGSRFSTVPKNNTKRRPINIEPFGNLLLQSRVGIFLRGVLLNVVGIDLDRLSDLHRERISQIDRWATLDLSDASNLNSVKLFTFLFPKWIVEECLRARSEFVLGPDDAYHQLEMLAAQGAGFTFEILSMTLTALLRTLDIEATSFGDDMLVHPLMATQVIEALTNVGFKVNIEKSFIEGPFRESCGAFFHSDVGYIESYDFKWPETIVDCALILNKALRLAQIYPSFRNLYNTLVRVTPNALRSGIDESFLQRSYLKTMSLRDESRRGLDVVDIPLMFLANRSQKTTGIPMSIRTGLRDYQLSVDDIVVGFKAVVKERTPKLHNLKKRHWSKYLMYLAAGRVCPDTLRNTLVWAPISFVRTSDGRYIRLKDLIRKD